MHNCNCYGDTCVLILYVTNNEHQSHIICFIYSFILASTQGMTKILVLVRLHICHDTSPDMLFRHTITPLSHIILDASHHTHLWWMFLSCSVGGHRFMLSDWWNGGGSVGASELQLEQQYNRCMEVGAALKQRAFWVAEEQCSIGLLGLIRVNMTSSTAFHELQTYYSLLILCGILCK